jgi:hypothetical protein
MRAKEMQIATDAMGKREKEEMREEKRLRRGGQLGHL